MEIDTDRTESDLGEFSNWLLSSDWPIQIIFFRWGYYLSKFIQKSRTSRIRSNCCHDKRNPNPTSNHARKSYTKLCIGLSGMVWGWVRISFVVATVASNSRSSWLLNKLWEVISSSEKNYLDWPIRWEQSIWKLA